MRKLIVRSNSVKEITDSLRGDIVQTSWDIVIRYEVIIPGTGGGYELYKEVQSQCESCIHPDVCKYAYEHQ